MKISVLDQTQLLEGILSDDAFVQFCKLTKHVNISLTKFEQLLRSPRQIREILGTCNSSALLAAGKGLLYVFSLAWIGLGIKLYPVKL